MWLEVFVFVLKFGSTSENNHPLESCFSQVFSINPDSKKEIVKRTSCSRECCDSLTNVHLVHFVGNGQESVVDWPTSATTFTDSPDVKVKVPLIRMRIGICIVRLPQRLRPHWRSFQRPGLIYLPSNLTLGTSDGLIVAWRWNNPELTRCFILCQLLIYDVATTLSWIRTFFSVIYFTNWSWFGNLMLDSCEIYIHI